MEINGYGQVDSLQMFNSLQGMFRTALARMDAVPAWSMRQIDAAREKVYRQHPGIMDLWRSLRKEG